MESGVENVLVISRMFGWNIYWKMTWKPLKHVLKGCIYWGEDTCLNQAPYFNTPKYLPIFSHDPTSCQFPPKTATLNAYYTGSIYAT